MKNHACLLARTVLGLLLTALQGLSQSVYTPYTFTTFAGNAGYGSADGTGNDARFYQPAGAAVDTAGNIFVADSENHTIRKVTPTGAVTTLAGLAGIPGSTDGTGSGARFYYPSGVAVDGAGCVFVADRDNQTIRKVTPAGVVTTLAGLANVLPGGADGTGSAARFWNPTGVALDSAGNLFVADSLNHTIRKVTPAGVVTTLAGQAGSSGSADGTGSDARFNRPLGVAVDNAGNVFVADSLNCTVRKVTSTAAVTTLAGLAGSSGSTDGMGSDARFNFPSGVGVDSAESIFVADQNNHTIRRVTSAGGVTMLVGLAGSSGSANGTGSDARFSFPSGVGMDSGGNVYVADKNNNTIRKVTPAAVVTTLAGLPGGRGSTDGTGTSARFWSPQGLAADNAGNVFVADSPNQTIRKVTSAGVVTTLAGLAGSAGGADGTGSAARFNVPTGLAVDIAGTVCVADTINHTIRKVTSAGAVTTLAGLAGSAGSADGTGSGARFNQPFAVATDGAGNVFVADTLNNTVRKVTSEGIVTTFAGMAGSAGSADGAGSAARFDYPECVAVDGAGNVFVADTLNQTIRKITPTGEVTTLAGLAGSYGSADGAGSDARFNYPGSVAVDGMGNVYVADADNNTIRKVTSAGVVTTLGGLTSTTGSADGTGSDARFFYPRGVAVDRAGNVYVADTSNNTIRMGRPERIVIVSSGPSFGFNSGQFGFRLSGPTGKSAVVEASADLLNWLPLSTNTFAGALDFSDPQSGAFSNRFYRVRSP